MAPTTPPTAPTSSVAAPALVGGLFFFYLVHDACQERCFREPGFTFGWFMTAAEILAMACSAAFCEGGSTKGSFRMRGIRATLANTDARNYLAALVVAIAISQGTGSASLAYVNMPVKVAFKSCKLIPTMLVSYLLVGRHHSAVEYVTAGVMCVGLALLGLADAASDPRHAQPLGFLLLAAAVMCDATIPNLQEKLLRGIGVPVARVVLISNAGSFVCVFLFIAFTGELREATQFVATRPRVILTLLAQCSAGTCGLHCYLGLVRNFSGVTAVVATSCRKVATIGLSFFLFTKPFNRSHLAAFTLWTFGLFASGFAKQRRKEKEAGRKKGSSSSSGSSGSRTRTSKVVAAVDEMKDGDTEGARTGNCLRGGSQYPKGVRGDAIMVHLMRV